MDAPNLNIINDYKWDYLLRRVAQTAAGGARLRLPFPAPLYVPALQLLVLAAPALLGVPLTLLLAACWAAPLVGTAVALLTLALQTAGMLATRRAAAQQHDAKTSALAQDDEVTFEGVCHSATWAFIVPGKRRRTSLLLQPLVAGLVAAAVALALSPEHLDAIVRHGSGLAVLYPALGWLSVCAGLYSVTAARPPEPATLQALDDWELAALNRPLHLLLLTAPLLVIRLGLLSPAPDWLLTCDVVCRLMICVLPLLWLFGVIPPGTVAVGWLAEQTLVVVCGGSPCVSVGRLTVQLALALSQLVLVCCLPDLRRLLPASVGGCLLSADVAGLLQWLGAALRCLHPALPAGWWRPLLYHAVCAAAAGAVTAAARQLWRPPGALPSLGAALLALLAVRVVYVELQRVYCAGLVRNCAYQPAAATGRLARLRATALRLHTLVTPLLLVVYITWETAEGTTPRPAGGSPTDLLSAVCLARCYRWVWQCPEAALLETVAVFVMRLLWPTAADWRPELLLTAVSWLRERLVQLLGKLYMAVVLQSSWLAVKERRRGYILLGVNLVLLPVTLLLLLVSCLVSAPLLPVCTLPLFVATFPRRLAGRQTSQPQTAGPDAIYYQQMATQTADQLGRAVWAGCAGFVQPGDYLLLRFEDRLMWVFVAEMGNGYIFFSIKGLELQETSCHAAEATRVDAIFDAAFDPDRTADVAGPLAPFWFHALTPLTQLRVPGYSDARSQLTGVIDNSATLAAVQELFPKVLIWTLVEHLLAADAAAEQEEALARAAVSSAGGGGCRPARPDSTERYRTALSTPVPPPVPPPPPPLVADIGEWSDGSQASLLFEQRRPASLGLDAAPWLRHVLDAEDDSPGSEPVPAASTTIRVRSLAGSPPPAAADSTTSSRRSTQLPPIPTSSRPSPPRPTPSSGLGSGPTTPGRRASRLRSGARVGPAPERDAAQRSPAGTASEWSPARPGSSRAAWQPLVPAGPALPPPLSAAGRRLRPPANWTLTAPAARPELAAEFPRQFWLRAVEALLDSGPRQTAAPAGDDELVDKIGGQLTMAGLQEEYALICQLTDWAYHGTARELGVGSTPARVLALYNDGAATDSTAGCWLRGCPALASLALRAYRWSVKLALDSVLFGGFDSDEELADTLREYSSLWYIGLDTDPDWRQAVLNNTPSLFSLGYDDNRNTYTSHLLSLGEQTVSVGSLSRELIRGIWASLALELLYVTNDDEERYSIQAHSTILRNLTVQAADPPLGYPVFSGPPQRSGHV